MRKTREHKLVEFLTKLPKESVDGLIDILTDFGKGRIALNSNVKEILLHEKELSTSHCYSKEFIELLITEYQLFAGNSIVNQVRKNLVTYKEIVQDVYSYLIDDSKDGSNIAVMEESILHKLLGYSWKEASFNERYKESTSKSLFMRNLTNKKANVANAGIAGLISRINIPVVIGTTILSLSTEAYRVMIPFILEVSWLKNKYGFYSGNTLPIRREVNLNISKRKVSQENVSRLNQLLSLIPDLLIKNEVVKSNVAVINIPLDKLTKAKDLDGLRGMVHGEKGIIENVRIYEPETLKNLINSGLLMNLASTLVAQKHLADINDKLNSIKEGIESIKDFLYNDRRAKINAAYNASNALYNEIVDGLSITDKELDSLASHLTHIREIHEHLQFEIQNNLSKIDGIKNIQSKDLYITLNEFNKSYNDFKLCCNATLSIYAILFILKNDEYYMEKINNIRKDRVDYLNTIMEEFGSKIDNLTLKSKSKFNFDSTELSNIAFQSNRKLDFEKSLSLFTKEISDFSSSFLSLSNQPKELQINAVLENGQIKEAVLL